MKYSQTLIDEYKNCNIASQKELRSISGNINLNHTLAMYANYIHSSATKNTVDLIVTDTKI